MQQIESAEPISLNYKVTACDQFTSELRVRDTGLQESVWHSYPVEAIRTGAERYRVEVDAANVRRGHKLGGTTMTPGCAGATSLSQVRDKLFWTTIANASNTLHTMHTFDLSML